MIVFTVTKTPEEENLYIKYKVDADTFEVTKAGALVLYRYAHDPVYEQSELKWWEAFAMVPRIPPPPMPPVLVRAFAPGTWVSVMTELEASKEESYALD